MNFFQAIPNLWFNDKQNNTIIKNEISYYCKDFDKIPFLDIDSKNVHYISKDTIRNIDPLQLYIMKNNKYTFKAFRGCPFKCTYCNSASLKNATPKESHQIRKKNVKTVIEDLKKVITLYPNIKKIHSNDEVFIMDKEWVFEFTKEYKKNINIPLTCDIHLQFLTEEVLKELVSANLCLISAGIEGFSFSLRKDVYKRNMSDCNYKFPHYTQDIVFYLYHKKAVLQLELDQQSIILYVLWPHNTVLK
ncbi:MAG: radical SAM protein [Oligoflexia bacterium]|nr:radical SAM protein [Oligoflexia bacterium]